MKTTTDQSNLKSQHEMLERAQERIKDKKRLYYHFVIFLVGSLFMVVFNKVLNYGEQYDWYFWGISAWLFILLIHAINVYITHPFLGREWERMQRERLIEIQQEKIKKIEEEVKKDYPLPSDKKEDTGQ
ncbi:2TM domain-containing protein [Robertkochia aurantiaca]|uniref:2TM domain-containing protein n=1 Tax=Robertkochia aurantiaca TaxID=2873700 RepID=UPI001CC9A4B8|nr:2TM domain-containing protein [Robertkochia sp. 3YJGBD-33]